MRFILFVVLTVLAFIGCSGNSQIEECLNKAEEMIEELPDSALVLLKSVDGFTLRNCDRQQARYALLYTKAQYKAYQDPISDSLINIAVDYYEEHGSDEEKFYAYLYQGLVNLEMLNFENGASSLLRAQSCSLYVEDHYALGQMYNNLAYVNSIYHCLEGEDYAYKAYLEYQKGDLPDYALDARVIKSSFILQRHNHAEFRLLIDSIIDEAERLQCSYVLGQALSLKAQYAVAVDSSVIAEKVFEMLMDEHDYQMTSRDYGNLAVVYANRKLKDKAEFCLDLSRTSSSGFNDKINLFTNAYWVYRKLGQREESAKYQDSLLSISEEMISEDFSHSAIAAQRDYSEFELSRSRHENYLRKIIIVVIVICFFATIMIFLQLYQKKSLQSKLQDKTIQKLQFEILSQANEIAEGLKALRTDPFVTELHEKARVQRGLNHEELNFLHELFNRNLPHFENSLHELTRMSEIEMYVCMLLKLYMTPGEISILLNKSAGAISSIRGRLFQKVFKKKGSTADWDAFIDTI